MKTVNSSLSRLTLCTLIIISLFYAKPTNADAPPLQLAYFIGTHETTGGYTRPGDTYYNSRFELHNFYKTNWINIGHGCKKSCLLDLWTGKTVKCTTRCKRVKK